MNRRLAVPLAVEGVVKKDRERYFRRILKDNEEPEDIEVLRKLIDTRNQIEDMLKDLESDPRVVDSPEMSNELDYIKASIQLSLLEITGELEETPYSEELFEEAVA